MIVSTNSMPSHQIARILCRVLCRAGQLPVSASLHRRSAPVRVATPLLSLTDHDRIGAPGSAVFYCNGKELWRWEDPRVSNVPSHLIIGMTTGGWGNNAVDDSKLPADYLIDYVRVWQRRDLASSMDG